MQHHVRGTKYARLFWLAGLLGLASTAYAHHEPVPFSEIASYNETFFRTHALLVHEGKSVNSITPIDVNGDGFLDLIVTQTLGNGQKPIPIEVYLNDGKGNFADRTKQIFPKGAPTTIGVNNHFKVIGDFNGDGRPDLFLMGSGLDDDPFPGEHPRLLLSSGAHGFIDASAGVSGPLHFSHGAAAGDIDGDGDVDVFDNSNLRFYMNDGTGKFTSDYTRVQNDERYCATISSALADLDGDGAIDLVCGNGDSPSVVMFNDGTGHFFKRANSVLSYKSYTPTDAVYTVIVHDFNGDGLPDLLLNVLHDETSGREIIIMLNQGGGNFVDATAEHFIGGSKNTSTPVKYQLILADVNNDGYLDIVHHTDIYLNDGTGRFIKILGDLLSYQLDAHGKRQSYGFIVPAVGDFDHDGRLDFIGFNGLYAPLWCGEGCPGSKDYFEIFYGKDLPAKQTGTGKGNTILGGPKAETLSGLGGNDIIFGAGSNDKIFGGGGNDYLNGGKGNDEIDGGPGDDTLVGGPGNDILIGGPGKDIFVFNAPLTAANVDTLPDFSTADDKIRLDKNIFKGLPKGTLKSDAFVALPGTKTPGARIFYNKTTGGLSFDADGTGPKGAKLFARTKKNLSLKNTHFVVY